MIPVPSHLAKKVAAYRDLLIAEEADKDMATVPTARDDQESQPALRQMAVEPDDRTLN